MRTIQAVVFDIGNVLVQWQPEAFYDTIMPRARRDAMFASVDLHFMNERIDRGESFRDTVYGVAAEHPEFAAEIRLWHDRWSDIATPAVPGTAQLAQMLRRRGTQTFLLSNIGAEPFRLACDTYPDLKDFDRAFVSGAMGTTKPGERIYQMVEDDCRIAPEGLLFIDDRQENLDMALARGWNGHLFTDATTLEADLSQRGML